MGAWDIFLDSIFELIAWIHSWCGDWGLAIIIVTIIIRLLIYPITRKQFKSAHQMQKLAPKMKEVKEKYADDQQRQQQETMKIYQEAKFNPLAGCLPMLLQMPIFIALFWVLRDLDTRIGTTEGVNFYKIIPDLTATPGYMFSVDIIAAIPYLIMLPLFAASLLIPMLLQQNTEKNMKIMMGVMSVVMLFFGWQMPAGVLLYWVVSSYIGVGQQQLTRKRLMKKDELEEKEEEETRPVKVEVDRAERKARPKKKH